MEHFPGRPTTPCQALKPAAESTEQRGWRSAPEKRSAVRTATGKVGSSALCSREKRSSPRASDGSAGSEAAGCAQVRSRFVCNLQTDRTCGPSGCAGTACETPRGHAALLAVPLLRPTLGSAPAAQSLEPSATSEVRANAAELRDHRIPETPKLAWPARDSCARHRHLHPFRPPVSLISAAIRQNPRALRHRRPLRLACSRRQVLQSVPNDAQKAPKRGAMLRFSPVFTAIFQRRGLRFWPCL